MDENKNVTRAAGVVGLATLLSRVLGFVRDMVVAYFFGASVSADAFFVAFRLPNLLRRLVAEGALTVSFIPIFSHYLVTEGEEKAYGLARSVLTLMFIILVGLSLLGVAAAPWIVRLVAPGFESGGQAYALTVHLTRIVFPYIFFVGLVALAMGLLNTLGRFAAPALAPVLLNVGMIFSVAVFYRVMDPPVVALAVGVLIGGAAQVALQIPFLLPFKGLVGVSFNFRHPGIRKILLLMGPAALGAAVYQLTIFINTLLASFLPVGSISALYYADRLVQFPLGVFGVAIGTAVLPSLSRQAARGDNRALVATMGHGLRLVFFITLPAMAGLILLARPIIQLLFERGRFTPADTTAAAWALVAYAAGLWAFSGLQVVVRAFYSLKDSATPVKIGVLSLTVNVIAALLLIGPLGHVGLALATSISSAVNLGLLTWLLRRKLGRMEGARLARSLGRDLAGVAVMCLGVLGLGWMIGPADSLAALTLLVVGSAVWGAALYLAAMRLLDSPELAGLMGLFRRA